MRDDFPVPEQSALAASVDWLAQALTGTLTMPLATLAIAGLGLALLQGRLPMKHAARIVLGCFVLFGAPRIAAGLTDIARPTFPAIVSEGGQSALSFAAPSSVSYPVDPYAGASVPR